MKHDRYGAYGGFFGVCPICHHADDYLNFHREMVMYCEKHRVCWNVGNLLHYPTDEEQAGMEREYARLGFDTFSEVQPYSPPDALEA